MYSFFRVGSVPPVIGGRYGTQHEAVQACKEASSFVGTLSAYPDDGFWAWSPDSRSIHRGLYIIHQVSE